MQTSSSFAGITERRKMPKRTKSGRKTAVADVESKLKREYPGNPGAVYGTLNKIGLKRGSKTTAKGMKPAKRRRG
ncbi:MAG TPA: hypothetical protein VNH39_10475 [Steroidobacteraceae bacterium]|nr:hypothetical protein [Steroidobacteraceae bacterium]